MPGHLRESRDSAAPEVPVDHRPEERVVPLLVLVRETGLEPVALEIDDPSELIRALHELAPECLQIGGREQLDQLRQLERRRLREDGVEDDEGGGVLRIVDREVDRGGSGGNRGPRG